MNGRIGLTVTISIGCRRRSALRALKAMEEGKADFKNFNAKAFFSRLLAMTMEGLLRRPDLWRQSRQGGLEDAGLSPGPAATYAQFIDDYRDKRYVADPQSIADFS